MKKQNIKALAPIMGIRDFVDDSTRIRRFARFPYPGEIWESAQDMGLVRFLILDFTNHEREIPFCPVTIGSTFASRDDLVVRDKGVVVTVWTSLIRWAPTSAMARLVGKAPCPLSEIADSWFGNWRPEIEAGDLNPGAEVKFGRGEGANEVRDRLAGKLAGWSSAR